MIYIDNEILNKYKVFGDSQPSLNDVWSHLIKMANINANVSIVGMPADTYFIIYRLTFGSSDLISGQIENGPYFQIAGIKFVLLSNQEALKYKMLK